MVERRHTMIDGLLFPRSRSSGSGPEIVSPIVVNDNVVDIVITPGAKDGDPAAVKIRPETAYVQMDADVRTGAKDSQTTVTIEATASGQFSVRGQVPAGGEPVVRIYAVDEPVL